MRVLIQMIMMSALSIVSVQAETKLKPSSFQYQVQSKIPLEGDERWDYLTFDSEHRRLYVTRTDHVDILDADSFKLVGRISNLHGVHGVALAPQLGRAYVSCGKSNSVVIFDLKTNLTLAEVKVEANPDAIVYDPETSRVMAFNGMSNSVSIIDTATNQVLRTLPLLGKPEFAVSDWKGKIFVNIEDKNTIQAIDAKSMKTTQSFKLLKCQSPGGLAMDRKRRLLFASCDHRVLTVVKADTGEEIATAPIGLGPDAVVFDSEKDQVLVSNGESGTLSVIQGLSNDQFKTIQQLETMVGARTLALDGNRQRLFLITARFLAKPEPTAENLHARPDLVPGSAVGLIVTLQK